MNTCYRWRLAAWLAIVATVSLTSTVMAQTAVAPGNVTQDAAMKLEKFVVTGSLIKRIAGESALPVQTITIEEIEQQGIVSAEQLLSMLNINGNGLDNLASNADVVSGAARGNNGATSANLRGQGAGATLVLLNGRRIASHGLNGGVVDLNSIPFAAIQRVETLKDGASAIYGTDAIGGVINFILRTDYQGLTASAATDVTDDGGGNIHRYSVVGGYGDLQRDKFNVMASFAVSDHKVLRGDQRDFVNTFQPNRGLSVDTRGTPIATIFPLTTLYSALSRDNIDNTGRSTGPADPANPSVRMSGGINIVDLPNGPGYAGLDGMGPYDEVLWAVPGAKYASAWDTGRAAVLQQPVRNTNLVTRGTFKLGEHRLIAEAIFGRSESAKSFSANQITSGTAANTSLPNGTTVPNPFLNLAYPSTGADYNRVFNALVGYFPALEANRGLPMAFRWRAIPAGNREIETRSDTRRFLLAVEGPLSFLSQWDYRIGASQAQSKSSSELTNGYFYQVGFANLINTGVLNPFSYTQTPEALAALEKVMARGVKLYGGTFTTEQVDATASGPLFKLPAGTMMAAAGVDVRVEQYEFKGDQRPNANTAEAIVFNAPFDNALATAGTLERTIKAAFVELQVPVFKGLDINPAVRMDHYTGFGKTTNPKITLRYAPTDKFLVRSTYSTGFRVPTFKQMFDPVVETTYVGNDVPDPASPSRVVSPDNPAVHPRLFTGGKRDLQPEEATMYSAGIVFAPSRHLSGNIDWWSINREGTVQSFGFTQLAANYALFQDRFLRDSAGVLQAVDTRWINSGETVTKGVEFGLRGDIDRFGGKLAGGFDLSYLLEKKSRLIASAPFGPSEVGQWTRSNDVGIRWKHTAFLSYRRGNWSGMINQLYRGGYVDQLLPGVANGSVRPPNWNAKVKPYETYSFSLTYRGFKNITVIAGVKNVFNEDPPFSVAYDSNSGAGSSWEPRVADPRGRSYTLRVDYKFY
jgi:iron complex outermembrane recepter protein